MDNFDLLLPTKVYFGKDKENEIGDIVSSYNFKRVFIVIGKGSVKASGLLDKVTSLLSQKDINYIVKEGVRPNPTIDFVKEALIDVKEYKPDMILAIGGGSVIDTAKSLGVSYYYDGDPFDFNLKKATPNKSLPVGVILTISAAGSEMSNSCVIQNDAINIKTGFNSEVIRPLFVIENPELTYSVNKSQTAFGTIDIMMHTLERYFLLSSSEHQLSDYLAEGLLKSVYLAGKKVVSNPNDYEARATLMLASSMSHNGLTHMGKKFLMPVHQLEHALSGRYPNVAHGEGLSILFPAWCKYYLDCDLDKFARLGKYLFDIDDGDKRKCGESFIAKLEEFFNELGAPTYLNQINLGDIDINELADIVTKKGTISLPHHTMPLNKDVAVRIYNLARGDK